MRWRDFIVGSEVGGCAAILQTLRYKMVDYTLGTFHPLCICRPTVPTPHNTDIQHIFIHCHLLTIIHLTGVEKSSTTGYPSLSFHAWTRASIVPVNANRHRRNDSNTFFPTQPEKRHAMLQTKRMRIPSGDGRWAMGVCRGAHGRVHGIHRSLYTLGFQPSFSSFSWAALRSACRTSISILSRARRILDCR